jgi:hypothetical protein
MEADTELCGEPAPLRLLGQDKPGDELAGMGGIVHSHQW